MAKSIVVVQRHVVDEAEPTAEGGSQAPGSVVAPASVNGWVEGLGGGVQAVDVTSAMFMAACKNSSTEQTTMDLVDGQHISSGISKACRPDLGLSGLGRCPCGVVPSSLAMIRPRVVLPSGGPCKAHGPKRATVLVCFRIGVVPPVRVVQGSPTAVRDGPMVPPLIVRRQLRRDDSLSRHGCDGIGQNEDRRPRTPVSDPEFTARIIGQGPDRECLQ